jgi:hypothetical protein
MNKKSIIQIVIIVICFGVAGMVLYNGFFKGPSSDLTTSVNPVSGGAKKEPILPFGSLTESSLVNAFKKPKFLFGQQEYPKLEPGFDIGIREEDLIKPLAEPTQN